MRVQTQAVRRVARRGQNLAELALTLPFLFAIIFACLELSHAWQTYEAAKLAAMDGAYTASLYDDAALGDRQLKNRLANSGIPVKSSLVQPILGNPMDAASRVGYSADVVVTYNPLCGGIAVPTLAKPIVIIPNAFDIEYKGVSYRRVY